MQIEKVEGMLIGSDLIGANYVVRITTDTGLSGIGQSGAWGFPDAAAKVAEQFSEYLVGQDPFRIEHIGQALYRLRPFRGSIVSGALSAIDIALWDIKGKHFGVPVSTLLGGRFRESVRAYATGSFKRDGVDRIEDNASEVARHRADGFHAAKIKIGFGVAEDLAVIRAVRDAAGPDMRLMIDANHGYDVIEAVRLGRAAAQYDIDWFEEPVVPEQLGAYREVRAAQPIPVAGGETWHSRWGMREPVETRAVDILQPDLAGVGGFTEAKRVADMAALHGIRVVPHVWGTAVHIAAALQFMAAMIPSPVRVNPIEPILEFDRTDNPFRQAVIRTPIEHVNGVVNIPDGPGLGIEINRDALAQFRMGDV